MLFGQIEGVEALARAQRRIAGILQQLGEELLVQRIVLDDEDGLQKSVNALTETPPTPAPPLDIGLHVDPQSPLIIVDVDEVLAMFMEGFERYIGRHGLEMRIDKFALFQNIYRPGETEHLDVAAGRTLFEAFFETDVGDIDVAPGAARVMAAWARSATIVILNAMPYPLIVNSGLKGPPVAALASRTSGPVAFLDDLLPNLESVAQSAPAVRRFQMVADARLRPLAFCAPDRHTRIDDWPAMGAAVAEALGLEFP
jgi:hypothetical protein